MWNFLRDVVNSKNHVLRRQRQRAAMRRGKQVAGRHHQDFGFHLRFNRKRDMHGHLVAVKIRVERCADQRMDTNRFSIHKYWLERLNASAMQRRSAVQ